ncbi:hypothetical protein SY83_10885 [Paenibacillus swuensis]|uniref:SLH domain-containing protein n=1 Tax=Paenibacillus swuensis TaxID=1178515 RepID=A0A172TIS7_9BACL|nr:S-layer homology domain-containing protein [Paenibacillus swuensis]ANE46693.1 hypothetical protein SY83_10885 [Paenibacillus swuensis]
MFSRTKTGQKLLIAGLLLALGWPVTGSASPPDYAGGVNNEYKYEEVVFLSGEPITFSGKMTRSEKTAKGVTTIGYSFALISVDPNHKGKLSRKQTFVTTETLRPDKGQTTTNTLLSRGYKEDIEISGRKYTLADYQFSKSDVIDNRPVSDYYSGNLAGKKVYIANKGKTDEEEITVTLSGGDVGFKNFWGSAESQVINQTIAAKKWNGTVKSTTSDSVTKKLIYQDNIANHTSFDGGYMRVMNGEMASRYEYNMPVNDPATGGPSAANRNIGEIRLIQERVPGIERLIVPKFRDTQNHWAQESIEKLYSLDILTEKTEIYAPNIAMNRYDFTVAVMKAADTRVLAKGKEQASVSGNLLFRDLSVKDANYKYMLSASSKGIVSGVTPNLFSPNSPLTRAQAVSILIRALGLETQAPKTAYTTSFEDDRFIPYWAKDAVYAAQEVGLIIGASDNRFKPNDVMTRADAAVMLARFLEFIEKDLKTDYTDNIVLY